MSDFGFVNRRGDNNRGGKRTSLTGGAGSGPQPSPATQKQQQQQQQQQGQGQGGGMQQAPPFRRMPPPPQQQPQASRSQMQGSDSPVPRAAAAALRQRLQQQPPPPSQMARYAVNVGEDDSEDEAAEEPEFQRRREREDRDKRKALPRNSAPVSILKRPSTAEDTDLSVTPAAVEVKSSSTETTAACLRELADLKASVDDFKKKTVAEIRTIRDSTTHFFGLVDGGLNGRALLYDSVPKEMAADKATAKADRDAWVKLSYPQVRVERTLVNGSTAIDLWLRAYAICARTSDITSFWVREKAEDDSPTFKRFSWYPTPDK